MDNPSPASSDASAKPTTPAVPASAATPTAPNAVVLQPRAEDGSTGAAPGTAAKLDKAGKPIHLARRTFHPSHKATFIALGSILLLIVVNGGVFYFLYKRQAATKATKNNLSGVSINQSVLDQLGVNRSTVGDSGEALVIAPNAQFKGQLSVTKDAKFNGTLSAGATSLTKLDAGDTSLTQLNVNSNSTLSGTVIRNDLTVNGASHLQGAVTIDKLLTANGGLNVSGNLTVGGALITNNFSASSLTSTSTLSIGGHIITGGAVPSINQGPAAGPAGTVSISGNDAAGTIAFNTGQAPSDGVIATVTFRNAYPITPHVIISPVGRPTGHLEYYVDRTATGFTIGTNNTPAIATGYVFDYLVEQ